jgi:hypothetical protein
MTNPTDSNPIVMPQYDQYYKVTAYDSFGCPATDSVLVKVGDLSAFRVRGTVLICPGDTPTLSATGAGYYEWSPDSSLNDPTSASPKVFPGVSTWYKVKAYDARHTCSSTDSVFVGVDDDCVWPGDANGDHIVDHLDILNIGVGLGKTGNTRTGTSWRSYHTASWPYQTGGGINYKHIDADGNGTIEVADTAIISQYFNRSYSFILPPPKSKPIDPSVYVHMPADTIYAGDTIDGALYMGSPNHKAYTIYGVGAAVKYKNTFMAPGSFRFDPVASFPCGGSPKLEMKRDSGTTVQFAAVRLDGNDTNGYGPMAYIHFVLKDTLSANYSPKGEILPFYISRVEAVDKKGNLLPVYPASDSVVIMRKHRAMFAGIKEADALKNIRVYPNPAGNYCIVESDYTWTGSLEIVNMLSSTLTVYPEQSTKRIGLNTAALAAGVYILRIQTTNGLTERKLIIQR